MDQNPPEKIHKVLIIEDDKYISKIENTKFQQEGMEVISVLEGKSALEETKKHKPDLIMLDLVLPGKNGFDVLAELKGDPETKDIPIIILSNLGREEDVERGLKLGASDYMIKKDYEIDDVIAKAKKIMGG